MKRPPGMSARQFTDALKRNGFRHDFLFWFKDTTGRAPNTGFSGIFYRSGKIARRATLAHLIRSREKDIARQPLPAACIRECA